MTTIAKQAKRYLVTGGAGFIGSHLVDALIAKGHDVVVLDDLSTGKRENVNIQATVIIGDTTDFQTVERAFAKIDGCFHLAAVASVEKSNIEWARTHQVNVTSTVNILEAARRAPVQVPVVYTSSAAVYGDCPSLPIAENASKEPLTAYGVDKYGCDLHARVAWHVHGVPNIGMRPFNVYGPRQDPGSPYSGVISIFFDRMRQAQPISIFGDGGQTRDFVFVSDAVKAFVTAMEKLQVQPVGHDEVNICTGRPTSIQMLADTIAGLVDYQLPYNYALPRKGDIRLSVGDPRRLQSHLDITLDVTLREGLTLMLDGAISNVVPFEKVRAA